MRQYLVFAQLPGYDLGMMAVVTQLESSARALFRDRFPHFAGRDEHITVISGEVGAPVFDLIDAG